MQVNAGLSPPRATERPRRRHARYRALLLRSLLARRSSANDRIVKTVANEKDDPDRVFGFWHYRVELFGGVNERVSYGRATNWTELPAALLKRPTSVASSVEMMIGSLKPTRKASPPLRSIAVCAPSRPRARNALCNPEPRADPLWSVTTPMRNGESCAPAKAAHQLLTLASSIAPRVPAKPKCMSEGR